MKDRDYEPPTIEKAALALVHHQVEPSKPPCLDPDDRHRPAVEGTDLAGRGKTYLSYNDLAFITRRHDIGEAARPLIAAMSGVLKEMVEKSTGALRSARASRA
jgi:hypothetical protein